MIERRVLLSLRKSGLPAVCCALAAAACSVEPLPDNYECIPVATGGATGAGGGGGQNPGSGGAAPVYPEGEWVNVTSNLAGRDSECGNISAVWSKPDEDMIIVGLARHGLHASTDGGETWKPLGTGAGSAEIVNRATHVIFDPEDTNTFYESGIYNEGGVYVTRDKGNTFKQLGDVGHIDLVSVDLQDPERKVMLAGGHEIPRTLWKSTDAGETWKTTAGNLPDDLVCTFPFVLDADTYLVGCNAPRGAVFRTTDAGVTWSEIEDYKGGGGNVPLHASDGTIYWTSPPFNALGIGYSEDNGVTWKEAAPIGFPTAAAPIELPDGRIAILAKDDSIQVTSNKGKTWKPVTPKLPHYEGGESWIAVAYSSQRNAFFASRYTCGAGNIPVHEESIMRFDVTED